MMRALVALILALAALAAMPAEAAGPQRAAVLVATCAPCHGTDGQGQPLAGLRVLQGRKAEDLAVALLAFRRGEKPATVMHQIVAGYSEAELEAMATCLASRSECSAGGRRR
jgi:cytochrome c553